MIGGRYRVVPYDVEDTIFYGTCKNITKVPIYDKFIKIKFEDITDQYDNVLQDKTILFIHLSDSKYINNWIFMKIMEPELTQEIRRYNKCSTLANMCRKQIPFKTRVEAQGTYINDVIVGNI
jgi:hypothetical protein